MRQTRKLGRDVFFRDGAVSQQQSPGRGRLLHVVQRQGARHDANMADLLYDGPIVHVWRQTQYQVQAGIATDPRQLVPEGGGVWRGSRRRGARLGTPAPIWLA